MYQVTNPATGEVLETFEAATAADVESAVARAHGAFGHWRLAPVAERAQFLRRVAALFLERKEELAEAITLEMGKLIGDSRGEMDLVASIFTYYADQAEALLADEEFEIEGGRALIQKRPLGALLGIMPWNYPYYQMARFAAPNLVLGNTIILKHSPICPRSAALIEQIMVDSGLPDGAYVNIYASNDQVGAMLADPRIQGVSLTGSERAGEAVAAAAGRNLKPTTLELGGSDPMVVLDTDDLDLLVERTVRTRMSNMGQACSSPKRWIVMADIYDDFVAKTTELMGGYTSGDPMDPGTTLAPVSSQAAADQLHAQIEDAVAKGATVHLGGQRPAGPGAFVMPTVLTGITPDMDAYYQELFGPVAAIYRAEDEAEAIRLANDSPYGLSASVFSTDPARCVRVGEQLDAGMLSYNRAAGSQADLPFGGIKRSGIGRELGALGIEAFMNKKIVRLDAWG